MAKKTDSVLGLIGDTPMVRLNRMPKAGSASIWAKLEAFNPMSSVKDRICLAMIEAAEAAGALGEGAMVVEPTSGNTGIGLAMVCAAKGYPLVVTMAESFSIERRRMMRFLGAKVVLTPRELKGFGMYEKARELAQTHGWFLAHQFETEANADIHEATTGREILADFDGQRLNYFVTGYGTGGTIAGVGRALRRERPDVKLILSEPTNAQLVASGMPQERTEEHEPAAGHPAFEPHPIQGWTPDFIPWVLQEALDQSYVDELWPVAGPDGVAWSRKLAQREGIFTGVSGGATVAVAMKVAEQAPAGSVILAMLPDTAERYLSTPLFEDIGADMDASEIEVMESTPGYRMPR